MPKERRSAGGRMGRICDGCANGCHRRDRRSGARGIAASPRAGETGRCTALATDRYEPLRRPDPWADARPIDEASHMRGLAGRRRIVCIVSRRRLVLDRRRSDMQSRCWPRFGSSCHQAFAEAAIVIAQQAAWALAERGSRKTLGPPAVRIMLIGQRRAPQFADTAGGLNPHAPRAEGAGTTPRTQLHLELRPEGLGTPRPALSLVEGARIAAKRGLTAVD